MLPPSSTPPAATPSPQRPRPYLPALIPGGAGALFLLCLWWVGIRHELRPPSEFHSRHVLQQVMADTTAGRLLATADSLERVAGGLEAQRWRPGVLDTAVTRLVPAAARTRALADSVRGRVGAREAVLARRHAKRLLWLYAFCVDVVVCIFAGLIALGATLYVLRARQVSWRSAAGVLTVTTMLSAPPALLFFGQWYDFATPPYALVEAALGTEILRLVRASEGLHILAVTLIVWIGVFGAPTLPVRGPVNTDADAAGVAQLAQAGRLFRLALYTAAAMLVVYVAAMSSLFQWVLAFVNPDPTVFSAVKEMTESAVTARGLLASGLLVFGFGASAAIMRLIAMRLATSALPEASIAERETWAQQQGLGGTGFREHLKTVTAVLAPFITGVFAQILQNLK